MEICARSGCRHGETDWGHWDVPQVSGYTEDIGEDKTRAGLYSSARLGEILELGLLSCPSQYVETNSHCMQGEL